MYRDFSESSKNKLLGLVSDVEGEKLCNFTDWVGDRWLDFESWIGSLNIKNYVNNVNTYHRKVIDKNNATKDTIKEIFSDVAGVDRTYDSVFGNIRNTLRQWQKYIDELEDITNPSNGNFNSKYMKKKLSNILEDIDRENVKCLKDRMVQDINGELTFNEELIYEYMKKNPAQMSDAEQAVLLEVISKLKDTVAIYETLATISNDKIGADLYNYVSWISENTKFKSFSAICAHYSDIYVNILNYIEEHTEDANTFAASLATLGIGESVLTVLGVEAYENLKDVFGSNTFKAYVAKYKTEHSEHYFSKLELSETNSIDVPDPDDWWKKFKDWKKKKKDEIEDKLKDKGLFDKAEDEFYLDKDGNEIDKKDAPAFYERDMTIGELKKEAKASYSVYDSTFDTWLGGKAAVTVGESEAHANFAAGLYLLDSDGNKVISPGISAEVGASVTAFNATYENQLLGNEMLGLNVDAEVTALQASAEASAEVNFLAKDDKGNIVFDPQVNVGVNAEAVLVEAEGSIGANVLGGEVELKGSVKVGVGANADIGYKDGVLKCEIGASLGIGFDVGFEVDVGGMVNTVSDACSSAWDGLKKGWNKLWDW